MNNNLFLCTGPYDWKMPFEVMAESISAVQCPVVYSIGARGLSKGVANTDQLLCLVLKSATDSGLLLFLAG